jgi:hypothetical protein
MQANLTLQTSMRAERKQAANHNKNNWQTMQTGNHADAAQRW